MEYSLELGKVFCYTFPDDSAWVHFHSCTVQKVLLTFLVASKKMLPERFFIACNKIADGLVEYVIDNISFSLFSFVFLCMYSVIKTRMYLWKRCLLLHYSVDGPIRS